MHTTQTAIVFSIVFAVLCGILSLCPAVYSRTHELSVLSVSCQEEENNKTSIYKVSSIQSDNNVWSIASGCPEKAYRFSRGVRDSVNILIG